MNTTLIVILTFNVFALLVMAFSGSDKNIESRTKREEDILKKNK